VTEQLAESWICKPLASIDGWAVFWVVGLNVMFSIHRQIPENYQARNRLNIDLFLPENARRRKIAPTIFRQRIKNQSIAVMLPGHRYIKPRHSSCRGAQQLPAFAEKTRASNSFIQTESVTQLDGFSVRSNPAASFCPWTNLFQLDLKERVSGTREFMNVLPGPCSERNIFQHVSSICQIGRGGRGNLCQRAG